MKTILITGISKGLGKELFNLFTSKGYQTYGVLRNPQVAEQLKAKLPKNAKVICTDLLRDEAIESIQKEVGKTPVDWVINNAGIGGQSHRIHEIESKEIAELFNIHCLGVFRTVKALRSNLLQAKEPVVLNLNSRLGSITRQSEGTYQNLQVSYSYRIAKASQNMLTNCLRNEFKGEVKFISIHPGKMKTAIAQVDADLEPQIVAGKIWTFLEKGVFKEENGIVELEKELIEW